MRKKKKKKKIDPTNGAKHFYIRKGEKKDNKGNIEDRPWYLEADKDSVYPKPSKSQGPFRNLGGGDVGKGNNIFIDAYKETKKKEEKENRGDGSKGSGSGGSGGSGSGSGKGSGGGSKGGGSGGGSGGSGSGSGG